MTEKLPAGISLLLAGLSVLGCSTHGVHVERLPDGSFEYKCDEPLWVCLSHVEDVCKGGTYVVLGGRDEPRMYGNEENRVEGHQSKALVRCLRPGENPKELLAQQPARAPVVAHSVPGTPGPAPAPALPAPARACVPGTTQACVGTAACSGGQACLADGSGFGPCDCGSR